MNEDLFYKCSEINDYLIDGDEPKARDLLIQLISVPLKWDELNN